MKERASGDKQSLQGLEMCPDGCGKWRSAPEGPVHCLSVPHTQKTLVQLFFPLARTSGLLSGKNLIHPSNTSSRCSLSKRVLSQARARYRQCRDRKTQSPVSRSYISWECCPQAPTLPSLLAVDALWAHSWGQALFLYSSQCLCAQSGCSDEFTENPTLLCLE